jgi:hypothetical protein
MRGLNLLWLALSLPGIAATGLLFRERRRIYRLAREYSTDPRDWAMACHDLRREGLRVVKQLLLTGGVWLVLWGRVPWVFEARSAILVAVGLLLLAVSIYDLRYTRAVGKLPLR